MATINISGTYYMFTVTAANATAGATYTNNGVTYTVKKTITAGTKLYCTATAGSVTSGTTLTKTTGTGDATITFSAVALRAHINGIGYVAGDVLNVSAGEYLDVDETPSVNPGTIQATTSGPGCVLNFTNTSTTTPIVITMNTENSDIIATNISNSINVQGDWIQIATGNGTASQTINFSTILGGVIDFPPAVWVETGDTRHVQLSPGGVSGYFMPFFNCGLGTGTNVAPDFDVAALNILTSCYGDLDHGPVFQYDATTKIATFGKGGAVGSSLGGAVIPNAARVIYPNIHFTSTVFNTTETSRNLLYTQSGSPVTLNTCAFSRNFLPVNYSNGYGLNNSGDSTLTNVAVVGRVNMSTTATNTVNNLAIAHNQSQVLTSTTVANFAGTGKLYLNNIFSFLKVNSTYAPAFQISNSSQIMQVDNIWAWEINPSTSGAIAIIFESSTVAGDTPLIANNLYAIGGALYMRNSGNIYVKNFTHSDQVSAVASITNIIPAIVGNNSREFAISNISRFTNGVGPRSTVASYDTACVQAAIHTMNYDSGSNAGGIVSFSGVQQYGANLYVPNLRAGGVSQTTGAQQKIRASNVYTNTLQSNVGIASGHYIEWQTTSSATGYNTYSFYDNEPMNPFWTNAAKTTGGLNLGPFPNDKNVTHTTVVSGTSGTDFYRSGTGFFAPGICEVWYTNLYPVRGITSFTGATWTGTSTSFFGSGGNLEFSMRNNDDTSSWGSWYDATVGANWQTALSAVSGYSSNNGFFIRARIRTTTTSSTGRVYNYGSVTCVPDSTWTPAEIGFVPISVSGMVTSSTLKLYDNTVPAAPVRVITKTATSSTDILSMPYNFDGLAKPYKLKVRKSGYGEASVTGDVYLKAVNAPVSQTQYTVISDAVASLITGVSVNGATNTVTITGNNTMQDIHQYLQWWGAQIANMDYEIPSVTTDNINYSSTYNWVLSGGNITGTGTINLGPQTFTRMGSETSTLPIIYSSGASVFGNVTVSGLVANSRVRLNNSTDNIELYNAVVAGTSVTIPATWTADKTLDLRVTNVSGVTAYLPYQAAGTLTSSMASFTVSQSLDTVYNSNAIDGSTVTEFITDYPNIQIDIDDPDGVTSVQRLYAWLQYSTHTSQGIVYYFNGILAQDATNYKIQVSVVDLLLDNTNPSSIPVKITGAYIFRDDGTTVIYSGSKSIQLDPSKAYIANSQQIQNMVNLIPALL